MTTIACDGKSMAGDGLITTDTTIVRTDAVKVAKLNDGRLIGFAGNAYNWQGVLDHFNSDKKRKFPTITDSFAIMVLELDGTLNLYDADGRPFARTVPCAIGSGRSFAMAAMDAGVDAYQAIEIASKRDVYTGGMITVVTK